MDTLHKPGAAMLIPLLMISLSACGGGASAKPQPTRTPRPTPSVRPTVNPTVPPAATLTSIATTTPTPTPSATHTPIPRVTHAVARPALFGASVRPVTVQPGGTLNASVRTSAAATRVVIFLTAGPGSTSASYRLQDVGPGSWVSSFPAPSSPGTYHFTITIFNAAGDAFPHDNDAWNVVIAPVPTPSGGPPATIPANLPLAPPFSFSNPTGATFTAEGRSISGAEVVSDSRPDISASAVAQFYLKRFPRSGWTIDQSTVPAPGATSFTIVATSGQQVCVVVYSASSIREFYGNLPGGSG
jgi:hypothetical protein